jgi:hypothetical protein
MRRNFVLLKVMKTSLRRKQNDSALKPTSTIHLMHHSESKTTPNEKMLKKFMMFREMRNDLVDFP